MSYEIKPQNIKSFVEDQSIKLPRFQRKQTWNDKKNFLLALSVFKGYPLGVSILNIETINGSKTKWLLDGRQRRNAFIKMLEDPESIYFWAKKYIGFKNTDQLHEIEALFEQRVSEYIEEDISDGAFDEEEPNEEDTEFEFEDSTQMLGTNVLLDIIKICHNTNSMGTEFSRCFNFLDFYDELPYCVNREGGGKKFDSRRLRHFILEFKIYCSLEEIDIDSPDSFIKFCLKSLQRTDEARIIKFTNYIKNNWGKIKIRVELVYKIESILQSSEIGLIEVSNISSTDAQKIFNIINTGGSLLTAAEILSAKPVWNIKVKNPMPKTTEIKNDLYKAIGISHEDVVRWDIPATVIKRFNNMDIFIPKFDDSKIEKQINFGFKLLAGQFVGGIRKEDINSLGSEKIIQDVSVFEEYTNNMNNLLKIINDISFFKFVKSWNKSMLELLSEAITLNFLILMFNYYKELNFPVSGMDVKKVQHNAIKLFDRMVYEYVMKQWRGSSDSKIARNLSRYISEETFMPVPREKWEDLITGILENNKIDDQFIDQGSVTPLLYYYYYLSSISGPDTFESIEVDHIIPKSLFEVSTIENRNIISNNLYNLQLLPKKENCSKNSKKLNQIDNTWLIEQISKYSKIPQDRFSEFSILNDKTLNELKNLRQNDYINAFTIKRNNILNNI